MKIDSLLWLGAIGGGGYLLWKSGVLGGVGAAVKGVGEGVGEAGAGLGAGVGFAGQAAGYNLADVFSAVGEVFRQGQTTMAETGRGLRDVQAEVFKDVVPAVGYAGDVPRDVAETASAWSGSLRDVAVSGAGAFRETWSLDEPTNIFSTTIGWLGGGIKDVFSWAKSQVSPTSGLKEAPSIIEMPRVIASNITSSSSTSSTPTAPSMSVSGDAIVTSEPNKFLEMLGYSGTSTMEGIVYTKPPFSFV